MVMLRLGSILGSEVLWVSDRDSVLTHYPAVPRKEAHPDDVITHLWPVGGGLWPFPTCPADAAAWLLLLQGDLPVTRGR